MVHVTLMKPNVMQKLDGINIAIQLKALREKCPNTDFFPVRIFLYSDGIQRFTE